MRGGFLDMDERVYVEQFLFGLKTVLQLVKIFDPWCEGLFIAGKLMFRQYWRVD